MMRLVGSLRLLPALLAMPLAACEPNQLYLASHTVVGINAGVNPQQTNGSLIIGYERTFATIIPRSVPKTATNGTQTNDAQTNDAMSALVCSNLAVEGITLRRFTESLATGTAAQKFADKLNAGDGGKAGADGATKVKDFFDCFKQDQKPAAAKPGTSQ
jgi:hypothetical protein